MKTKLFVVAVMVAALLFVGCSTFTPMQGNNVLATDNFVVLGRVTLEAATNKSGFNPGGIGSGGEQQEEKATEFAVLAELGLRNNGIQTTASDSDGASPGDGGTAVAPGVQIRLTLKQLQFVLAGTMGALSYDTTSQSTNFMIYGGVGYKLVRTKLFDLSTSVVAGMGGYTTVENVNGKRQDVLRPGFLVGADLLAMLKLGKHLGIYANGLLSTGGIGAKLGVAYRF